MSPITLSVEWDQPTFTSGDSIQCTISLQNNRSPLPIPSPALARNTKAASNRRRLWRSKLTEQATLTAGSRLQSPYVEHSLSRHSPVASHRTLFADNPRRSGQSAGLDNAANGGKGLQRSSNHQHGRSVSIISVTPSEVSKSAISSPSFGTSGRSHVRAVSLQSIPRTKRAPLPPKTALAEADLTQISKQQPTQRGTIYKDIESSNTQHGTSVQSILSGQRSAGLIDSTPAIDLASNLIAEKSSALNLPTPGRTDELYRNALPAATVYSTPRNSLDAISQSNRSTETLVSDYVTSTTAPRVTDGILQKVYPVKSNGSRGLSETLMMGYAHLTGYFTLDSSLVNPIPFENVKKKGIIGAKGGGGVVGVESTKSDNGFLGSLGLSNLGRSIGGIVGTKEPSTIREMRGVASAKAVPIISTPQSVLFVDLLLGSGEMRKFRYSHPLPRGLPPSFKGRAIKVNYHLTIGVQRSTFTLPSHVLHHVDIPFRILPDEFGSKGKIPVYNLKSPYIILEQPSEAFALGETNQNKRQDPRTQHEAQKNLKKVLVTYVSSLLVDAGEVHSPLAVLSDLPHSRSKKATGLSGLLSRGLSTEHNLPQTDQFPSSYRDGTRFDIHRSRKRVATIVLARSKYKLGDIVLARVDFRGAQMPCYSLQGSLESIEEVDDSIALRSPASVARATRRMHASRFETTICARRVLMQFEVPSSATPSFETSGVRLKWYIRFEFTARCQTYDHVDAVLLERAVTDERGIVLGAAQELIADAFEVTIPIRIQGASLDGRKVYTHSYPLFEKAI